MKGRAGQGGRALAGFGGVVVLLRAEMGGRIRVFDDDDDDDAGSKIDGAASKEGRGGAGFLLFVALWTSGEMGMRRALERTTKKEKNGSIGTMFAR